MASASSADVTTNTRSAGTSGAMRSTVSAMSDVSPPASGSSCFGRDPREAGQKRVPEPPAMMTANTVRDMRDPYQKKNQIETGTR